MDAALGLLRRKGHGCSTGAVKAQRPSVHQCDWFDTRFKKLRLNMLDLVNICSQK